MAHKNARNDLTAEFVRWLFDYDPKAGVLRWKNKVGKKGKIGAIAGYQKMPGGRWSIGIQGRTYLVHRIIWLWVTGEWPEYEIDHADNDPSNNRIDNLRAATSWENLGNRPAPKNNTSGSKGVNEHRPGKWIAKICIKRKQIYLGTFATKEEAQKAFLEASRKMRGEFSRT